MLTVEYQHFPDCHDWTTPATPSRTRGYPGTRDLKGMINIELSGKKVVQTPVIGPEPVGLDSHRPKYLCRAESKENINADEDPFLVKP